MIKTVQIHIHDFNWKGLIILADEIEQVEALNEWGLFAKKIWTEKFCKKKFHLIRDFGPLVIIIYGFWLCQAKAAMFFADKT